MKHWLRLLLDRIAPVKEGELSRLDRWDSRSLPCKSCLDGFGRIHHCEAPASCTCTNPAVHH
jgi:hypothetical protein